MSMAGSFELDGIDRTILSNLRSNARMSLQEMSRQSGISDATLHFRLKRLKASGAIERFTIIASPAITGYSVAAIIMLQTDTERHDLAESALADIPEVTEVYGILGEYDLFVKVWSKSLAELNTLINDRIRSIDGIEDLHEMVVVKRVIEETPLV